MTSSWKDEDWSDLATLLPGTKFSEYVQARAAKLDVNEDEDGDYQLSDQGGVPLCAVSVSEDDIVEAVTFNDEQVVVDGVHCGMSFDEISKSMKWMRREWSDVARDLKFEEDCDCYLAPRDEKTGWNLVFLDDELIVFTVFTADDDGLPEDPIFGDLNFRLVVLESLIRSGRKTFPENVDLGAGEEFEDEDEAADFAVWSRLLACFEMPLTQDDLDSVTSLEFDGGHAIYRFIDPEFDGESFDFDIVGIEGIEHLRNLKTISFVSMTNNLSLRPLENHPALESISFSAAMFKHFSALLSVPNLKSLGGFLDEVYEEDAAALDELEERGIEVQSED